MVPGVTKGVARVEPRWEDGIFLGVSDRSDELHVGTERHAQGSNSQTPRGHRTSRPHVPEFCVIMKHGLTEGCLGCRCFAEGKRAQGHSEGCRTQLEAEIAKTEEGRIRSTTAYLRGLARDEGRGPGAGAEAPAAVAVPPRSDEVQDEPTNAAETSRKRSAEDACHEADDAGRGAARSRLDD